MYVRITVIFLGDCPIQRPQASIPRKMHVSIATTQKSRSIINFQAVVFN